MKSALALALLATAVGAGNAAAAPAVRVRISNEQKRTFYNEGFVWFVRLDRRKPDRVNARSILLRPRQGRHVVHAFIRPCDGNCSLLDAPTMRCAAVVHRGQTATYHLRDRGCLITVHG